MNVHKTVTVKFTFDDGYGSEFDLVADVAISIESERRYAEVVDMTGLEDRDGEWLSRLQDEADEKAIELAWDQYDAERRDADYEGFCDSIAALRLED